MRAFLSKERAKPRKKSEHNEKANGIKNERNKNTRGKKAKAKAQKTPPDAQRIGRRVDVSFLQVLVAQEVEARAKQAAKAQHRLSRVMRPVRPVSFCVIGMLACRVQLGDEIEGI